jgi:hypothetical protein
MGLPQLLVTIWHRPAQVWLTGSGWQAAVTGGGGDEVTV